MADNKLKFDLVAPERLLMSAEVDMVAVPGSDGDFGVLPGHAPVMSTLRPGVVDVDGVDEGSGGGTRRFYVRGGFAEVTPEGLTVLAEDSVPLDELDAAALDQEIKNAEEDVADARTDEVRARRQETLDHLRELKNAL